MISLLTSRRKKHQNFSLCSRQAGIMPGIHDCNGDKSSSKIQDDGTNRLESSCREHFIIAPRSKSRLQRHIRKIIPNECQDKSSENASTFMISGGIDSIKANFFNLLDRFFSFSYQPHQFCHHNQQLLINLISLSKQPSSTNNIPLK